MKKTILLTLAFAVSVLLFTSCEKETPSVGSSQDIYGDWECTSAPSNSDAYFIKGDILTFRSGRYELVHPDENKSTGSFSFNGIRLNLVPDGSKAISFNVNVKDSNLALSQDTGMIFGFKKNKS